MAFDVYTDLDSVMDTRYGVLTTLLKPSKLTFEQVFGETYDDRVVDEFVRPELGIDKGSFEYAFDRRNYNDLVNAKPSNLMLGLLNTIVTMDNISGKPIEQGMINLTVNIWPYELDQGLIDVLANSITEQMVCVSNVSIINKPAPEITANWFKRFGHVCSYYTFKGKDYANFQMSFATEFIPEVKFLVPSVHAHQNELSEYMNPEVLTILAGMQLASVVTIIPISPNIFDYRK